MVHADAGAGSNYPFLTSKERDNKTGLDYFGARYYSSMQGRFTSPDEFRGGPDELYVLGTGDETKQALPYAEITNPQSINKYQYVYNNPLRYVDPSGHCPECAEAAIRIGVAVEVAPIPIPVVKIAGAALIAGGFAYLYRNEIKSGVQRALDKIGEANAIPCNECAPFYYNKSNERNDASPNQQGQGQSNTANPNPNDNDKKLRFEGPVFKTNSEAAKQAKELGFTKIGERVHGQAVFKKGNQYITRDVDGHSGGAWKVANSVKDLGTKSGRLGTYDRNLKKIAE